MKSRLMHILAGIILTTISVNSYAQTVYANDAGVVEITSPVSPVVPGSATVTAKFKNFGTTTLSGVYLNFAVNGGTPVSYLWMGNLTPNSVVAPVTIGNHIFTLGMNILKVWTSSPNGIPDSNNINDTMTATFMVCQLMSGTYTIGASAADFSSFNAAHTALLNCGIGGPVIFNVLPGIYQEQLSLSQVPGASAANRITFQSLTGNPADVVLKSYAATNFNYTLKFNGADYFTIQNITLVAENPARAIVVNFTGNANHNILNGNIIQSQPTTSDSAAGIFSNNAADNYNLISNNKIYNGYYGINMSGVDAASPEIGLIIENNLIEGWYFYGLNLSYINDLKVRGNTIRAASGSGINYGARINYCKLSLAVTRNRIECRGNNLMNGLAFYNCDGNDSSLIANNFVAQTFNNNTSSFGLYSSYSTNMRFYHNTVRLISSYTTSYAVYILNYGTPVANIEFINNIFVHESNGFAFYANIGGTTGIQAMDYNNIYSPTGYYAYCNNVMCANLAELQLNTFMNASSVNINPAFISPAQLYPGNIALDNKGTYLPLVANDIDGKIRSVTTPDIGAAEFTINLNDAGIVAVTSPVSPMLPGNASVAARFKNFGVVALNSVYLNYSVNGGTTVSYLWTGSLAPDSTMSPVVIGNNTFALGINTLKVWTSSPNAVPDSNNSNDTMTVMINVCQPMSGTFTIGDTLADFASFNAALNALMSCGINGTVTFNVMPGTYAGQLTIPQVPGASAANRVIFQSSTGNKTDVVITFAPLTTTSNWVVKLDGADYISFLNLTIQVGASASAGYAVYLGGGADHNLFQGNLLQVPVGPSSLYGGIYNTIASLDQYNIFNNNTIQGGYYGAYFYGMGQVALEMGNVIENNVFQDYYMYGFSAYYQDGIVLNKNSFTNSTTSGTAYGIHIYYADNNIKITRNRIHLSGSETNYPLNMYYCDGTPQLRGLVANNFLSYAGPSIITINGMNLYYNSYQNIYHNSVSISGLNTGSRAINLFYSPFGTYPGLRLKNNIFSNFAGGFAIYQTNAIPSIEALDYNNYYTTGVNLGYWGGNLSDLAALQSASLMDSNSVSTNPNFLSTSILTPYSVVMNNKGTYLTEVPDDIDGKPRSLVTPDLGAAEYDPPTDDAGLVTLLSPTTPSLPGVYPVSVSLKNFGQDTLTTVKLNYQLDTLAVQSQWWVGSLMPDSVFSPVVLGSISLGYGSHTLKAWTSDPNNNIDASALNDTITLVINVCDQLDTVYTIGDTLSDYPSFTAAVNAMINCGISNTVIFNVKPGIYNEQLTIPPIFGASSTTRVVFQSATGNPADVVLTYSPSTASVNWVLRMHGADYITVRNITIKVDTAATNGYAVRIENGADYNIFEGNIIESIESSSSLFYAVYNSPNTQDQRNVFINNIIRFGYDNVYWYGINNALEVNNYFEGNTFEGFYHAGVTFYHQDALVFSGNQVSNSSASANPVGASFNYCHNGIIITSNKITLNGTSANTLFQLNDCNGLLNTRGLVANNILHSAGTNAGTNLGMHLSYSSYQDIYHNTLHIASGSVNSQNVYVIANSDVRFKNNLLSNYGGGYTLYNTGTSIGLEWDYNDLYTSGTNIGWYAGPVSDLSTWMTATNQDKNSVSIDPVYSSLNTLKPTAIALDNKGTTVGVGTDYLGILRDTLTPDIGALEFGKLPLDLALIKWDLPNQYSCGLSTAEQVKVSVYNNSIAPQSGFTVKYSINGGISWQSDLVQATIASGDTLIHTFTQTADFSALMTYHCIAAVIKAGDMQAINDTLDFMYTTHTSVDTFPVLETMEGFTVGAPGTYTNGWTIEPNNGYRWQVNSGVTATGLTGPDFDHTTGTVAGKYSYTEADAGATGSEASLISPCLDLSGLTAPLVRFWYYMYGSDIGKLSLDVAVNGVWQKDVYVISGQQQTDSISPWQMANVSLTGYPGTEKIRFRATRGTGPLGDVAVDDITIDDAFSPVVANAGSGLTICAGDTAQLNVIATGGVPPYSYAWSPAASLTNATTANPKAFPLSNTTYAVSVTDQNGASGTDDVIVTVNQLPVVTLAPLANVCVYWPPQMLGGGNPAGGNYSGPGVSAGVFTPAMAGLGSHLITYTYLDPITGCTGHASQNISVDACIGISEPAGLRLELFPNPATDVLNIKINGLTETLQLRMMNVEGQSVYKEQLSNGNANLNRAIDVSKLPAGVYYIRLEGEKTNKVEKVIIE